MKKILVMMAMLAIPAFINAQSKLDNLVFEKPDCLIKPKGEYCNIRQSPNQKSKKTSTLYGITGAKEFNPQWYKTSEGYVSKSAVLKVKPTPITSRMQLPNFYADIEDYESWEKWWLCDDIGTHHLALYYTEPSQMLYLGKRIDDILIFKYFIHFSIDHSSSPKMIKLGRESKDGEIYSMLTIGDNYYIEGDNLKFNEESHNRKVVNVNPTIFNDKIIEKLFGDVINSAPNANLYLTGENFPEIFRNQTDMAP